MSLVETAIDTLLRRPPRYREIKAKNDAIKFTTRSAQARLAGKDAKAERLKKKAQAAQDRVTLEQVRGMLKQHK